jgi:SEC-C motif
VQRLHRPGLTIMNLRSNDPCHCGSGRKYAQCHLGADQAAAQPSAADLGHDGAVERAMNWLTQHHRKGFKNALTKLMDEVLPEPSQNLSKLHPDALENLQINLTEWLLAEGEMYVKGPQLRISEVLLGEGGPPLSIGQREWLAQMARQPLRLYHVTEVRRGEGVTLCDALDAQALPMLVRERLGSASMTPGLLIGCRIMDTPTGHELSGAVYPFSMLVGHEVAEQTRAVIAAMPQPDNQRTLIGLCIARAWIRQYTQPPRMPKIVDAQTGEAMLLINDHYRVLDAPALAKALGGCSDVTGDATQGWRREFKGADGQVRSAVSINPGKTPDRLELFYSTQRYADDGRAWFETQAGATVKFLHREIDDPQELSLDAPVSGGTPRQAAKPSSDAASDVPPEVVSKLFEQTMRRVYANWADEPIPLLDNKTPRQAMQSAAGLERVKGLLRSYEANEAEMASQDGRPIVAFDFLWDALGITR